MRCGGPEKLDTFLGFLDLHIGRGGVLDALVTVVDGGRGHAQPTLQGHQGQAGIQQAAQVPATDGSGEHIHQELSNSRKSYLFTKVEWPPFDLSLMMAAPTEEAAAPICNVYSSISIPPVSAPRQRPINFSKRRMNSAARMVMLKP